MVSIRLSSPDYDQARHYGILRARRQHARGRDYASAFHPSAGELHVHTLGTMTELAVARYTGLPWRNPYSEIVLRLLPDVGEDIEVRTINPGYGLSLRAPDFQPPKHRWRYVAVDPQPRSAILSGEPLFEIVGWAVPHECEGFAWQDPGGYGAPLREVPRGVLYPPEALISPVQMTAQVLLDHVR